jgi:hypothetical protein
MAAENFIQNGSFPNEKVSGLKACRSVAFALLFVIFLIIVAGREYPELLTLTDHTCNDYTFLTATTGAKVCSVTAKEFTKRLPATDVGLHEAFYSEGWHPEASAQKDFWTPPLVPPRAPLGSTLILRT